MANRKKTDFLQKTVETLAKRVGYFCSNPNCRKHTALSHSQKDKAIVIGEAAHIKGQKPGVARFDPTLASEEIRNVDNGIWLCRNCHKRIDADEKEHTVVLLKQWKVQAETNRGDYKEIIEDAVKATLNSVGFIPISTPKPNESVLKDKNIKESFDKWLKGDITQARNLAENAYYESSGSVKLQAIINIIFLSKEDLTRTDYLIALCDEGISLANTTKSISTEGILKAHKARLLNNRIFTNSLKVFAETQMRQLTGFPLMNNAQLIVLASVVRKDGEDVQSLAKEAQEDAIKAKDYAAIAHIKMTLASTMGQMYLLTKQLGGNYGELEHYVIRTYLEAKQLYEKLNDNEGIAYVLHNLANNLRFFGQNEKALKYAEQAFNLAKKTQNKELENKTKELFFRLKPLFGSNVN